jgi:hypothetical protein
MYTRRLPAHVHAHACQRMLYGACKHGLTFGFYAQDAQEQLLQLLLLASDVHVSFLLPLFIAASIMYTCGIIVNLHLSHRCCAHLLDGWLNDQWS